jgi:hypothetical protein
LAPGVIVLMPPMGVGVVPPPDVGVKPGELFGVGVNETGDGVWPAGADAVAVTGVLVRVAVAEGLEELVAVAVAPGVEGVADGAATEGAPSASRATFGMRVRSRSSAFELSNVPVIARPMSATPASASAAGTASHGRGIRFTGRVSHRASQRTRRRVPPFTRGP